jgi:hypothetical protein
MGNEKTFDAVTWLAGRMLLDRGAIDTLLEDGLDAAMKGCPYNDLTPDQAATIEAMCCNTPAIEALRAYWEAYDAGRETGAVPNARALDSNPWL